MNARWSARGLALAGAVALAVPLSAAPASALAPATAATATPEAAPLTNLDHLDFLLGEPAPPADVSGHTTYRLAEEPTLLAPWTYADARDGGDPPPVTLTDARASLELITALYASARGAGDVTLPIDPDHPLYRGWLP